jgi:hypothetical protein
MQAHGVKPRDPLDDGQLELRSGAPRLRQTVQLKQTIIAPPTNAAPPPNASTPASKPRHHDPPGATYKPQGLPSDPNVNITPGPREDLSKPGAGLEPATF